MRPKVFFLESFCKAHVLVFTFNIFSCRDFQKLKWYLILEDKNREMVDFYDYLSIVQVRFDLCFKQLLNLKCTKLDPSVQHFVPLRILVVLINFQSAILK